MLRIRPLSGSVSVKRFAVKDEASETAPVAAIDSFSGSFELLWVCVAKSEQTF